MIRVACSTTVGDAGPESPLRALIVDLARITHDRAVEHWSPRKLDEATCSYKAFAGERGQREAFAALLEELSTPADQAATHLADWDRAQRPVAIVHWFERELDA